MPQPNAPALRAGRSAGLPAASALPVQGLPPGILSAIIARGPARPVSVAALGVVPSDLGEFVVVPLDASRMHARLGADDRPLSEMEADAPITLHLARELGFDRFALIESDAEGGQAATVYHGRLRAMPVRQGPGAINEALERIGVRPEGGRDAFDTLGLGSVVQAGIGASG